MMVRVFPGDEYSQENASYPQIGETYSELLTSIENLVDKISPTPV